MPTVKLLYAMAFHDATWKETGVADPVIRVRGEFPATAEPLLVHRIYQGPQGDYEESFLLLDPDDVVIYERPYHLIELRGEMYEDRFQSRVTESLRIDSPDDHHVVFLIDGAEVGRIPVFVDAPDSAQALGVVDEALRTALKKSDIVWLSIPQPDGTEISRPAWFVLNGERVYVLTGPGEQQLTNIEQCEQVRMTVKSKDVHAAIATVDATVETVAVDSDDWEEVTQAALGSRLNLVDREKALDRWREACRLIALTPQG